MGSTFKQQLRREQFRLKDLSLSLSQQAVSSPVTAAEFGQAYLCIAAPSEKSIANLSDQSQLYIDNLKIYLLRILARTPALNYLNDRINYNLTEISKPIDTKNPLSTSSKTLSMFCRFGKRGTTL